MAAKNQNGNESKKRKFVSGNKTEVDKSNPKKSRLPVDSAIKGLKKPFKSSKHEHTAKPKFDKSENAQEAPKSKRELRVQAKELAEARKKKRKRHYSLEQELASLWEQMRQRDIAKEKRSKLISDAIKKMKGKTPEIAGSHVSSRVLQTCVKYCSKEERDAVFEELRPHFLTLACNTYAVHLVTKMLDNASKEQLAQFISSLHGHVASHLRHMVGSVVIENAYQLANATQKQSLLLELYSTELQLFKDLGSIKETKIVDIIAKLQLQKSSVVRHMSSVLQPILEKGIVDHSVIHRLLMEYFSIADKTSAAEILQQLSGPLLVRMIHTKDGSRIGILCVKHGSAKERKKIIKGMKDHVKKIADDKFGTMLLACILSTIDDTKLATKIIIRELEAALKDLVMDKNGRRPLLQLLHPNCSRYFSPDEMASINLSIPSLSNKGESEKDSESKPAENGGETVEDEDDKQDLTEGGKKDPLLRRQELLINSGLAEKLLDVCCENSGELLRSNVGKDVIYEVASGGSEGIFSPDLDEKLQTLHEAIASLVSHPKTDEEAEEEHLLENFHSSRTIRRLVLDSPSFASTLWKKSLKGNCKTWAQGHSCKVVSAYLETSDSDVRELARKELKPLIDSGALKVPETK